MLTITEHLLEAVYAYPVLYDVSHPDHKNARKKAKIWKDIGKTLDITGNQSKKKWKNLRDSYIKHLRTSESAQCPANIKNYKKWLWSTEMERFRPFFVQPKVNLNASTSESLQSDVGSVQVKQELTDDVSEFSEEDSDDDAVVVEVLQKNLEVKLEENVVFPSEPQNKKRKLLQCQDSSASIIDRVAHYAESDSTSRHELDSTDHLMLGYSKTIKSFSSVRQADIKFKIAQLVYKYELDQIREDM